ncbi:hypothetical protein NP233_g8477 [Leucocoprinus birnbaumii]|uniref:Uncharacterized protein n=1 Tax=Leucocoprinus birnbaumii TaxID=56174 RepID=A0AAD5VM98_9AGAR|nr:hypothetical protein NP233_g8477 [Leucocoprinus birnbaumii]
MSLLLITPRSPTSIREIWADDSGLNSDCLFSKRCTGYPPFESLELIDELIALGADGSRKRFLIVFCSDDATSHFRCYSLMPSHTAASGLIKLYEVGGAPWNWPAWQERTGIYHGLFPDSDELLPSGWSRQDAIDVKAYFNAYIQLKTEDQKIRFATRSKGSGSNFPGQKVWNSFVSKHWNKWGLHNLIVEHLRECNVHPMALLSHDPSLSGGWPHADNYVVGILDPLGMELFGEEAFSPGWTVLSAALRSPLLIFVQRSWNTIRGQVKGMRSRRNEIEATAKAAFVDLETDKPTKAKVARAIRAVAKWKEAAELFCVPQDMENAENMLTELSRIMEGLGARVKRTTDTKAKGVINSLVYDFGHSTKCTTDMKPKETCKVSAQALKTLATEEDVSELVHVYNEYFQANVEDEGEQPLSGPSVEERALNDSTGDLGMEAEGQMSLVAICKALGFRSGLPLQFNDHRHRGGVTPWDDDAIFNLDPRPVELERLKLHWHQLAGVHSIIRSIFTPEKSIEHTLGVLIGDEVGLGKTAQAITTVAFLNQLIYLKANNLKLPPIIDDRPWLGGSQKVPSLPHLIVCPGTLVTQWVHELKVLLLPKSVDILVYDSQTDSKIFWGPDGPVQRSHHAPHNHIIVASHSVIFNDFKKLHSAPGKKKNNPPWKAPPVKPTQSLKDTIFGQFFLSVIVDEAHQMRNLGNKHTSMLRLLQQAKVSLIMTATPIHTAPKDIISMGRLIGLPYFFSELCVAEEREDNAMLRRAKKLNDDGESLRAARVHITRRLHDLCKGHFLRRTTASLDWAGRTLLPLPPYIEIIGLLQLSEREMLILHERQEAAKAALLSISDTSRILTKTFYLEYRTGVAFAKKHPAEPYPKVKSLEEWELIKSTKMATCAEVCKHYLTHDSVADVEFVDGKVVLPDTSLPPGTKPTRARRIIIYSEFSSMAPFFQAVLWLYGISSLTINGQMSFDQRDKCVKDFYSEKNETRVLIFSSVGSAGLNLAIADVVIFFDQPWSAQDEQQIRGRAHRQPQNKVVKVIYLLAKDSADLLLHGVARGKRDMFNAFMNSKLAEEFQALLQGQALDISPLDDPNADNDEGDVPAPPPRPRRSQRTRRQLVVDDDEPENPGGGSSAVPDEGDATSDGAAMSIADDQETRSAHMSEPEERPQQPSVEPLFPEHIAQEDARSDRSGMDIDPDSAPESNYSNMSVLPPNLPLNPGSSDHSPPHKRPKHGVTSSGQAVVDASDDEDVDRDLIEQEREMAQQSEISMKARASATMNRNAGIASRPSSSMTKQHPTNKSASKSFSNPSQGPLPSTTKTPRPFLLPPSNDPGNPAESSPAQRSRAQQPSPSSHTAFVHDESEQEDALPSREPGQLEDVPMPGRAYLSSMLPKKNRF